jgi:transcription factor E2F7/8
VDQKAAKKTKKKPVASKEKSLGRLSQKFIQLFLCGNETIALTDASDKILGRTPQPDIPPGATATDIVKARNSANKVMKTKIRRLYDIANVMASIGLITKLNGGNNMSNLSRNKPSFKWTYPVSAAQIMDRGKAKEAAAASAAATSAPSFLRV